MKKLNPLIAFCNELPEMFRLATPEIKRQIIQTCCRTLSYDGKNLYIEQFPLFYEMKKWKNSINGVSNGIKLEPDYVKFCSLCLQARGTIKDIKYFLYICFLKNTIASNIAFSDVLNTYYTDKKD